MLHHGKFIFRKSSRFLQDLISYRYKPQIWYLDLFAGYKKAGTTRAVPAPYSDLFSISYYIKILYATIKNFNRKIKDNT